MTEGDKLKLAREAAASVRPYSYNSALILDGERDGTDIVQSALAAINALSPQMDEAVGLLREAKEEMRSELEAKGVYDTPRKMARDLDVADRITAFLAKQGEA